MSELSIALVIDLQPKTIARLNERDGCATEHFTVDCKAKQLAAADKGGRNSHRGAVRP